MKSMTVFERARGSEAIGVRRRKISAHSCNQAEVVHYFSVTGGCYYRAASSLRACADVRQAASTTNANVLRHESKSYQCQSFFSVIWR